MTDSDFWIQYQSKYASTDFSIATRDLEYINIYLLAKFGLVEGRDAVKMLHSIYPNTSHFSQLGQGAGKVYKIEKVI